MINTNGITSTTKPSQSDRILAQANLIVPDSSPELLKAVGLPQFTLYINVGPLARGSHIKNPEGTPGKSPPLPFDCLYIGGHITKFDPVWKLYSGV